MLTDKLAQLEQRTNGDRGTGLLTHRGAPNWIEHPIRHGNLNRVLQLDDHGRLSPLSQGADYCDSFTEERMVTVTNLAVVRVMSSVLTP